MPMGNRTSPVRKGRHHSYLKFFFLYTIRNNQIFCIYQTRMLYASYIPTYIYIFKCVYYKTSKYTVDDYDNNNICFYYVRNKGTFKLFSDMNFQQKLTYELLGPIVRKIGIVSSSKKMRLKYGPKANGCHRRMFTERISMLENRLVVSDIFGTECRVILQRTTMNY